MKVNVIAITEPKTEENIRKATPELLASVLARYSRSNEGIDTILSKINWDNPDESVDKIFKFVDYGHASIGGMTGGIAVTIDECSMFLAYKIFDIANLVDGQESSTRYIKMDKSSLMDPEDIDIPKEFREEWLSLMSESFELYNKFYKELDEQAINNPEIMRIPKNTPEKVANRIRKNYALDRARYFIPMATKTSAAYVMTARVWAEVIKQLESLPIKECIDAARLIRNEVSKIAPRLMKHSFADEASIYHAEMWANNSLMSVCYDGLPINNVSDKTWVKVDDDFPSFVKSSSEIDFAAKINRYSTVSSNIKRTMVRFAFNNIAMAELRDLNRHRTGYRYSSLVPVGFYLPPELEDKRPVDFLRRLSEFSRKLSLSPTAYNDNFHFYCYLLGTQVDFEHSTHLDKVIYEIELRTGLGAHFRYAEHMKNVYDILITQRPEYEYNIEIGFAEPE